ncbi:MAG: hypothetical protein IJC34_00980 [Lentisphaeria bacterium]|nr:hypothetical protein [Lentisphaeria bacterium]
MKCYGRYYNRLQECRKCGYRKFCADAADVPLLPRERAEPDGTGEDFEDQSPMPFESDPANSDAPEEKRYTRQDLLEVISFMVRLDLSTLEFLDEKIAHPEFGYADLARKRNISRQAVHKFIRQRCRKIPELESVLLKSSLKKNQSTTFMEEVCKIRKKVRRKPSKRQKTDLNSLKKLTCSIRSLDLSGTSMFSGGNIWKSDSKHSAPR